MAIGDVHPEDAPRERERCVSLERCVYLIKQIKLENRPRAARIQTQSAYSDFGARWMKTGSQRDKGERDRGG